MANKHVTELDKDNGKDGAGAKPDTAPPAKEILEKDKYDKYGFSGERVRVTIHEQPDDLGRQPVYAAWGAVGKPAYECLIPRGIEVTLPKEVFESCIQVKMTDYPEDKDGNRAPREVARFAYTFHGKAD